jgi:uncharacterized protein
LYAKKCMTSKIVKVVFDTNVWISFLIGKQLSILRKHISDGRIKIIITPQLVTEIRKVTSREKLKKHGPLSFHMSKIIKKMNPNPF